MSTFWYRDKPIRNTFTTISAPEDRDDTYVGDGTVRGPNMVIRTTKFQMFLKLFFTVILILTICQPVCF